jgi:three-Cys-motif partner protein
MKDVCVKCDHDKRKQIGSLCDAIKSPDGLPFRCIHRESSLKLKALKYYLAIFCKAMKDKHENSFFIDLFSGPGLCYNRNTGSFEDGSSILAVGQNYPFTNFIFADIDKNTSSYLKKRCESKFPELYNRLKFLNIDANKDIDKILKLMDELNSISVVFIDPNGLDIHFNTIKKLSRHPKMDLIINFSISDYKRNKKSYLNTKRSKADLFFGIKEWCDYKDNDLQILQFYKSRLKTLGFKGLEGEHEGSLTVRGHNNSPIYHLVYASKHSTLGVKFWKDTKKKYNKSLDLFIK